MKSGNLNFLEPSGPLQASNGTDLPFTGSDDDMGHTKKATPPPKPHLLQSTLSSCSVNPICNRATVINNMRKFNSNITYLLSAVSRVGRWITISRINSTDSIKINIRGDDKQGKKLIQPAWWCNGKSQFLCAIFRVPVFAGAPYILSEDFRGFSRSLQANSKTMRW